MVPRRVVAPIAMLALAWSVGAGAAAETGNEPTEEAAEVLVQPAAMKAVDDMAAYLRTLKEFRLTAMTTMDDILDNGQKIEIAGKSTYQVRTPDRLRLDMVTDKQERIYFYDGKTVTQYAPALDYYSVVEAPETIAKMIVEARDRYGVQVPLADLFFWGAENSDLPTVTAAYFAGESAILGTICNHYAYRVEGADVQLWIRKDGNPLPCRLVIANTDEESRPQYGATLDWQTDVDLGDAVFAFAPAPGVGLIDAEVVEDAN